VAAVGAGPCRRPATAADRGERRGAAVAELAAAQLPDRGRSPRLRPRVDRGTVLVPARPAGPAAQGPALPGAARRVCRGVLPRPCRRCGTGRCAGGPGRVRGAALTRSEEHTSELQSRFELVCRLLLEKK